MPEITFNRKPSSAPSRPGAQIYKNLLFETVLLFVVILLFAHFLLLPKRQAVKERKIELAGLNEQNDSIEKNTEELNALISKMKAAKKDISVLDEALPLDSRITTVHVLLDSLVSSSGLTLANITTDTTDNLIASGNKQVVVDPFGVQRQLQIVPVTLSLTGSMDQFLSFLRSLETNARITDVSALEITGNKNNLASFRLTLRTYFYGPATSSFAGQPAGSGAPYAPASQ